MMELRYSSGNVISPEVHEIGILAVGSHLENHGAALPIDTDSKIAAYLALQASLISGAKFLGILHAATEYDYVKHGIHIDAQKLAEDQLLLVLESAKKYLNIKKVVLVNGHGGNIPLIDHIEEIEKELKLKIVFNNKIVEIEGPHAGTGELSMGSILKIADESKLPEHCDFKKYPEVGMVGLKEARIVNEGINDGARAVEKEGVCIDVELGKQLLDIAVEDIMGDIKKLVND
ncbi:MULTISPECIES: 2-amino-5-formylamino-6-ribosylaminopyrimidin-4(3H)-one 5'-monophosphate deformylase [Methanobacterium]|uniref:2-amino-5-formylamino-6-ribosylaminopyrimidin-4(3H)-one 5'-monophosphate deformylase n=1 Tax=Methanobacterium bryantii TaxID=2161 RepID=A0A2A2HAA8_METBR|nr:MULTISPECIES: 2-amino-5-formylamino-6-ribosylaminopyrimidin-4(3H)-one 5'-monophosphate deformylase [Methanobacterium]OEC85289.1 creatinine amidohydrolase [Methanobacterium sp. A39]PAV06256.1 creatinine amidohydrolase [Methanobacterium bryantii]